MITGNYLLANGSVKVSELNGVYAITRTFIDSTPWLYWGGLSLDAAGYKLADILKSDALYQCCNNQDDDDY